MAIDQARLKKFLKEMKALRDNLSIENYYRSFNAKLLNYLDKNKMDGASLREFRKVVERFYNPEFRHFADDCFRQYNDLMDMTNTLYADLGPAVSRDFTKIKAIEKINRTRLGEYRDASAQEIAWRVREGIAKGYSATDLSKYLQPIDDKVQYYAHTIAKTQSSGYAQECKNEKSRIAEVFLFEFTGPGLRDNSHAFCVCMYLVTCHIDDIEQMLNGTGMPVLTYKGGFNCVHVFEPDPFATEKTEGYWQEGYIGKRLIRVYSPNTLQVGK